MQKTIQIQDMSDRDAFTTWRLPQGAIARFGQGQVIDLAVSPDGGVSLLEVGRACGGMNFPHAPPLRCLKRIGV